jgi:hypothetical protein
MTFTPTPAEARKYALYDSVVLPSKLPDLEIRPMIEGGYGRCIYAIARIPRDKRFHVYIRGGLTPKDVAYVTDLASKLSAGWWAKFTPAAWHRHHLSDGRQIFLVSIADPVDDPFVQLELEMMVDLTQDVN